MCLKVGNEKKERVGTGGRATTSIAVFNFAGEILRYKQSWESMPHINPAGAGKSDHRRRGRDCVEDNRRERKWYGRRIRT